MAEVEADRRLLKAGGGAKRVQYPPFDPPPALVSSDVEGTRLTGIFIPRGPAHVAELPHLKQPIDVSEALSPAGCGQAVDKVR